MENVLENTGGILKEFPKDGPGNTGSKWKIIVASFVVVLLGLVSGYFLSNNKANRLSGGSEAEVNTDKKDKDGEAGVSDESAFPDTAVGILVEGGIDGEGNYHLERPGGPSQNVYLTSTVVDLGSFVGKKVQVYGQTLSAIKAGWLMDVGKVKVID
jgi:hypothetical protein